MASDANGPPAIGEDDFEALYERVSGLVFRTVFMLCGNRQTAEDATQEAFVRALERWHRLRGRAWAAGWIMTTAMNEAKRSNRKRTTFAGQAPPPAEAEASAPSEVWEVVSTLPRRQQEAIALYYVADLPISEIGRVLACSEGTVKKHLWRARQVLAARLEVHTDD